MLWRIFFSILSFGADGKIYVIIVMFGRILYSIIVIVSILYTWLTFKIIIANKTLGSLFMIIDGNQKEKAAMQAFNMGNKVEGQRLQDEFVAELLESIKTEDHCSCSVQCKYHGKCLECVAIHRAHREHLPCCFWDMVNDKIATLSELTEHSIIDTVRQK
jgi:hypothetical protein